MDAPNDTQNPEQQPQKKKRGIMFYIRTFFIVLLALALLTAGFMLSQSINSSRYRVDVSRPAVIQKIRSLARLETASFTIEKIIDAGTTSKGTLRDLLFADKLLLIAHGQVIAGFDLSQMSQDDIKISGRNIEIVLPPAQILVATLDNNKTRVYDRDQGIFSATNKDLETEARSQAQASIRQAACDGDILDEATRNVKRQLTAFLEGLEFETVSIVVPQSSCK